MLSLIVDNTSGKNNATPDDASRLAEADLRATFRLFGGKVIEARCFDERKRVYVGYFDDENAFVRQVQAQDRLERTCYVGLNPPDPGLLARHNNKIRKGSATADVNIIRRIWLLIDVDPKRLADTPSTDEEKARARAVMDQIIDYLRGLGWPEGIIADSANGYHLLQQIDLPNDQDSTNLLQGALNALEFLFGDDHVSIDTSVYNASRITKAYGTTPRKGDGTAERPHRPSRLLHVPDELEPVNRGLLVALKNQLPETPKVESKGTKLSGLKSFDVGAFIDKHDIEVLREKVWTSGPGDWQDSRVWLVECPWNGHTDYACHIIQSPDGVLSARCKHDSCQGKGWRDFRLHYDPKAYDREPEKGDRYPRSGGTLLDNAITADELSRKQFAPAKTVVPRLIPEGLTLFAGKPKFGKSMLMLNASIAVATGGLFLGNITVEQGTAIYISLEDNYRRLKNRLRDMLGDREHPKNLILTRSQSRLGDGFEEELQDFLESTPDCRLVVIDTLKRIRPHVSGKSNKNIYDADYEAIQPLVSIAEQYGVGIVVVHHTNKMVEPDDPFDAISGSTGLTGAAEQIMILNRERGSADAFLYTEGKDLEGRRLALEFYDFTATWVSKGDADEYKLSQARRQIRDALKNEPHPLTADAVAQLLSKKRTTVSSLMMDMVKAGQLTEVEDHKYHQPTYKREIEEGESIPSVASVPSTPSRVEAADLDGMEQENPVNEKAAICRENVVLDGFDGFDGIDTRNWPSLEFLPEPSGDFCSRSTPQAVAHRLASDGMYTAEEILDVAARLGEYFDDRAMTKMNHDISRLAAKISGPKVDGELAWRANLLKKETAA